MLVDELVRQGVREAVLCPGSRNAPLSFALHDADRAGRLRLHVRIDERTAGFLALALAKVSGLPVPVVTTSGTAAVNLHPAVVEADYSDVRLVVLTADRPAELRGTGANQTIDQVRLYGGSVRFFAELSVEEPVGVAGWRDLVGRALVLGRDGPVHLNVAFGEPLMPDADRTPSPSAADTPAPAGVSRDGSQRSAEGGVLAQGLRTVVVAGDRAAPGVRALAEAAGWPLLAEPSSGARAGPNALGTYRLWLDRLAPEVDQVVLAGRPTLSRPITRLLAREDVEVVRLGHHLHTPAVTGTADAAWLDRWTDVDRAARDAVDKVLAEAPMNGPGVARLVAGAVPADGLLVAGSSSAIRDLDLADPWDESPLVLANRGASGIDGTVSTAIGAALAHQRQDHVGPTYALMGDLTFLHDSTGLVIASDEPRPDLTIVVVNDDGGGLFTQLEQGAPEHAEVFERVFGTPHGADLGSLCAATGTAYALVRSLEDLRAELGGQSGIRVVEVPTDRRGTRALHARLRAAVEGAVG